MNNRGLLSFMILLTTVCLYGQDRQFGLTYQSTVLGRGGRDIEVHAAFHSNPRSGSQSLKSRIELELGLGHRLQTALYLNFEQSLSLGGVWGNPQWVLTSSQSISSEWKYNLLSAASAPVGVALYTEGTAGADGFAWENKIIIDRVTRHHLFALNVIREQQWNVFSKFLEPYFLKSFIKYELTGGYMYRFSPSVGIGIEAKWEKETGSKTAPAELVAGPTFYYAFDRNFLILNVYPEINLDSDRNGFFGDPVNARILIGVGI